MCRFMLPFLVDYIQWILNKPKINDTWILANDSLVVAPSFVLSNLTASTFQRPNILITISNNTPEYIWLNKKCTGQEKTNGIKVEEFNFTQTKKPVGLWQCWKHSIHTDVSDDKLLTTTIVIGMPKSI